MSKTHPIPRYRGLARLAGPVAGAALTALALGGCGTRAPASATGPSDLPRPGLVVLVVVDQLPYRLLERYADLFTGAFHDLRSEGLYFTNVTHDHAVTETAPGHATLSTGTHPAKHGIVGNGWLEPDSTGWRTVENIVDRGTPLVGAPGLAGGTPRPLERTGLADWLLDASPESRIVSLSGKDRAAILLAGRAKGTVYWYASALSRFATSEFYAAEDPAWVQEFNTAGLAPFLADSVWNLEVAPEHRGRAAPDSLPFEGDGIHVAFPHERATHGTAPGPWLASTPSLDAATLAFARQALSELELGKRDRLDLLALGLSQTDRIGHAYGPSSLEQLDNLLRLDRELGRFLHDVEVHLDGEPLTVVLTADHGVLEMPELREARGMPGRRLGAAERNGFSELVRSAGQAGPPEELAERLESALGTLDWIAEAWTLDAIPGDSLGTLERNNLYQDRFPGTLERYGVGYRMTEGTLDWGWHRGTTHGSPYHYDRHVPLAFHGTGLPVGRREERTATTDVAPTIAAWLGLPYPKDVDGRALLTAAPLPR